MDTVSDFTGSEQLEALRKGADSWRQAGEDLTKTFEDMEEQKIQES